METQSKKISQLMMELYSNPELKEKFIANPKEVMIEKGIEVPEGKEIKVLEETETVNYIVLPHLDENSEITTDTLERKISKVFAAAP
jgi:hypothetical protein